MKALIVFLISSWVCMQPFHVKDGNNSSTTTTTTSSEKTKIPLNVKTKQKPTVYSLSSPTAFAYIENGVLTIDINDPSGFNTITIINSVTGEMMESQAMYDFIEVDLSCYNRGKYLLVIETEFYWFEGEFNL